MKKTTIAFLILILGVSGAAWAQEHGRGGGGGGQSFSGSDFSRSGGGGFDGGSSGVGSMSQSARSLEMPSYGPRGESFHSSYISGRSMNSSMVRNNMSMARSSSFESQVRNYDAHENLVGHYYWHNYNGTSFCHYYDRWGCNWYGWYGLNGFYWSCWWDNYWWWYDPAYYRWCYWDNGWYWEDPYDSQDYVYDNGQYAPVAPADENQAPANENANGSSNADQGASQAVNASASSSSLPQIQSYESVDHARLVKVVGASHDAFLYDIAPKPSFKSARYLASGVQDVHFSKQTNGKQLQIMLGFTDGSFALYNANGKSIGNN